MRITKQLRERMARSIMADIPETDFAALARAEVLEAAVAALPPKVRALWDDPVLCGFVKTGNVSTNCGQISAVIPTDSDSYRAPVPEAAMEKFRERCGEQRAQRDRRAGILSAIKANLASVSTDKALRERFPDFASYLPAEVTTANLPATNDLAERLKAAGWVPNTN